MYYTANDIWQALYDQHNADGDNVKEAQIQREVRKAYKEICGKIDWDVLRDNFEYDLTDDAAGVWMSPDLAGILGVGSTAEEWVEATRNSALKTDLQVRSWYWDDVSFTPLASGADITLASGGTTFSNPGGEITAAMVGEYIRFNNQDTSHKLTSTTTIATPYYGTALTGAGAFQVRPAGSKKLKLVTPSGLTDSVNPYVYFWNIPTQLYVSTQLVHLRSSALLEQAASIKLFTIQRNKEMADSAKKDFYGSKGRYEGELSREISMNPVFEPPWPPRSIDGRNARFTHNHTKMKAW